MQVITVRKLSDKSLVAFGPDNGMYDPGYNPAVSVKALEPDYETVFAEWTALQAARPPVPDKRAAILGSPTVPQWFKDYIT